VEFEKLPNLTESRGRSYEKRSGRAECRAAVLRSPRGHWLPRGDVVVFARVNGGVCWGDVLVFCPGHGARVDVALSDLYGCHRGPVLLYIVNDIQEQI
jgi:hypothetical protein